MNNFLDHLLLREGGIYVLFGSKPVVFSNLCSISYEKYKQHYENIPENIKRNANKQKIKLNFYIQNWENVQRVLKLKINIYFFLKNMKM